MQFLQDGTEFCQLIYADYLDDNGNYILADDTRLDAADPQEDSNWHYEYRNHGVGGIGFGGYVGGNIGDGRHVGRHVGGGNAGGVGGNIGGVGGNIGGNAGGVGGRNGREGASGVGNCPD